MNITRRIIRRKIRPASNDPIGFTIALYLALASFISFWPFAIAFYLS